jgi:hypothetical protein
MWHRERLDRQAYRLADLQRPADVGIWQQQAAFLAAIAPGFRRPYFLRLKAKRDILIPRHHMERIEHVSTDSVKFDLPRKFMIVRRHGA